MYSIYTVHTCMCVDGSTCAWIVVWPKLTGCPWYAAGEVKGICVRISGGGLLCERQQVVNACERVCASVL